MKIMLSGIFEDKPIFRKILILGGISAISSIILLMTGAVVVRFVYGIDVLGDANSLSDLSNKTVMNAMRILQVFSTGLGMFLIPALIAALVFDKKPASYLMIDRMPGIQTFLLTIALVFALMPLINMIYALNQQLILPDFLAGAEAWIKQKEDEMAKLTEAFLKMENAGDLIANILVIGVITAIAEEFLFRGVIQKLFMQLTGNIHVAILLTSILFSAIHVQFYGFFPRLMLGMLFGYLLVWSGSLWVPVAGHMINNTGAVIFAWYASKHELTFNHETIGSQSGEWWMVLLSLAGSAYFCYRIYVLNKSRGVA
jgi:membrane protease YdiL (CAAX protease family)